MFERIKNLAGLLFIVVTGIMYAVTVFPTIQMNWETLIGVLISAVASLGVMAFMNWQYNAPPKEMTEEDRRYLEFLRSEPLKPLVRRFYIVSGAILLAGGFILCELLIAREQLDIFFVGAVVVACLAWMFGVGNLHYGYCKGVYSRRMARKSH